MLYHMRNAYVNIDALPYACARMAPQKLAYTGTQVATRRLKQWNHAACDVRRHCSQIADLKVQWSSVHNIATRIHSAVSSSCPAALLLDRPV
jgi:hypothetical protein